MHRKVYHDMPSEESRKDIALWNDSWSNRSEVSSSLKNDLVYNRIHSYLSHDGLILEAGCGNGKWAHGLSCIGYAVVGLDFSPVALKNTKSMCPDCMCVSGDVRQLPFLPGSFANILSWGVLEHLEEGFHSSLADHHRCLSPNGKLFISLPRLSPSRITNPLVLLRRLLGSNNMLRQIYGKKPKCFFQYEYTDWELRHALEKCGFRIDATHIICTVHGIEDDTRPFSRIFTYLYRYFTRNRLLEMLFDWYFSSFFLYICTKTDGFVRESDTDCKDRS